MCCWNELLRTGNLMNFGYINNMNFLKNDKNILHDSIPLKSICYLEIQGKSNVTMKSNQIINTKFWIIVISERKMGHRRERNTQETSTFLVMFCFLPGE